MSAERGESMLAGKSRGSALCICATVLLLAAAGPSSAHSAELHGTRPLDVWAQLSELAQRYEIEIEWRNVPFPVALFHGDIEGRTASREELAAYLPIFLEEFSIYPKTLVAATGLRRVVFCRGLSFDGQLRAAVPDWENSALYLDVLRGDHSSAYQRKVIHHEFFHVVDYRDDGELYSDSQWSMLNPRGFRYGAGGAFVQEDEEAGTLVDTSEAGFLSPYSLAGVEEDKAEVFALLLLEPLRILAIAAEDRVIGEKVRYMQSLLEEFCADMDSRFWEALVNQEGR